MFATSPFSGQSASVFINFGQQPFTYPVTGYEGLYQTWEEWATFGSLLYDENQGKAIRTSEAKATYGTYFSIPEAGLQYLTKQPAYQVAAYIQQDDGRYCPIEDAEPVKASLAYTEQELVSTQNDLNKTNAQLAKTQDVTKQLIESNLAFRNQLRKEGIAPDRTFDIKLDDLGLDQSVVDTMPVDEEPPKKSPRKRKKS